MGDALSNTGRIDPAAALYDEAMALRAKRWGPRSVRLALEHQKLAMAWASQERSGPALREFRLAEDALRRTLGREHNATLLVTVQRARLEVRSNFNPHSMADLRRAASLLDQRSEQLSPRPHFEALMTLAEALQLTGDLAGAQPLLIRAMNVAQTSPQARVGLSTAMTAMAFYLQETGAYEQARPLLQRASNALVAALGPNHPHLVVTADYFYALDMAEALGRGGQLPKLPKGKLSPPELILFGRTPEALALARYNWAQAQTTPTTERQALSMYAAADQLGRAFAANGQCDQAIAPFREALRTLASAHRDSPYLLATRSRLGLCLLKAGDAVAASALAPLVQRRLAHDVKPSLGPHLTREARQFLGEWRQRSEMVYSKP
jgi:tetratricopeptide (TPR) repeat protein